MKRIEALERMDAKLQRADAELLKAINHCKLNNAENYVRQPDCNRDQTQIREWVHDIDQKVS